VKGILTLVPTPIDEDSPLEQVAFKMLNEAALEKNQQSFFVLEDLRPGRRRWLRWGLPRSTVDNFILYNEHTWKEALNELLNLLKQGNDVYLMSDGGLPAFCDPGTELINQCHLNNIEVTCTPFANSVALALALSGFDHKQFVFEGFIPVKQDQRQAKWQEILGEKRTVIVMDTPYRLKSTLNDLIELNCQRQLFLGCDLNSPDQTLLRGKSQTIFQNLKNHKREFILILAPL
jgi:16S rRNA (cytidine1402-2'-O)-methyltransferase